MGDPGSGRTGQTAAVLLTVPAPALVCLVGASGSGKSSFARRHFGRYEVLSSDTCRGMVSDDENDQDATAAAFDVLHHIAGKRLERGRLTLVDATSVEPSARRPLLELARAHSVPAVAVVLDLPLAVCLARNAVRPDRTLPVAVLERQVDELHRSLGQLAGEGFAPVHVLRSEQEVADAVVVRAPR